MAGFCCASIASAQQSELADGVAGREAATSGSTEVAKSGFEAPAAEPEEETDARELRISLGGLASAGNSRSLAVTSGGKGRMRQDDDQLTVELAANFARSAADDDESMETTVENYQGRTRYDRFLGQSVAAFLGVSARRDRFQGLDLRINVDPGLAYYFLDDQATRLWTELGYDLQYDVRSDEALDEADAEGTDLEPTNVRHNGRLFMGYESDLSDQVSVGTSIEYLQAVPDTQFWRLNWDGAVNAAVGEKFSVATTVTVEYDNTPLPGVENTDIATAVSLVYQLL